MSFASAGLALSKLLMIELERRDAAIAVAKEIHDLDDLAYKRIVTLAEQADQMNGIAPDSPISLGTMIREVRQRMQEQQS
jgi:hypothetical protein